MRNFVELLVQLADGTSRNLEREGELNITASKEKKLFWNCVIRNQTETWINIMIMLYFLSTIVVGNIDTILV